LFILSLHVSEPDVFDASISMFNFCNVTGLLQLLLIHLAKIYHINKMQNGGYWRLMCTSSFDNDHEDTAHTYTHQISTKRSEAKFFFLDLTGNLSFGHYAAPKTRFSFTLL